MAYASYNKPTLFTTVDAIEQNQVCRIIPYVRRELERYAVPGFIRSGF